jgi:hypothetical protein
MGRNLKGPEGLLLISVNSVSAPTALVDIPNQVRADILDLNWFEHCNVTDVDGNFTETKADATTRKTARLRWEAEAGITRAGEVTFSMLNDNTDKMTKLILAAWNAGKTIPAWDLDYDPRLIDADAVTDGVVASGLVANFSIEVRMQKPVKGLQTMQVTLKVETNPLWIVVNATADVSAIGTIGSP